MMELSKRYKLNSCSWTRENVIITCSITFLILCLLDGTLTLLGLGLGAIEEVNPVMQCLIEKSPIVFMAVKSSLPVILGLILWKIRSRSLEFVACSLGLVLIAYAGDGISCLLAHEFMNEL